MMISLYPAQAAAAGAMRAMDRKRLLGMLIHPRMAFRLRAHTISIGRTSAHGMVDIDLSLLGGAHVRRASRLQVQPQKSSSIQHTCLAQVHLLSSRARVQSGVSCVLPVWLEL